MRVGKLTSLRSSERVQVFQPGCCKSKVNSPHPIGNGPNIRPTLSFCLLPGFD